VKINATGYNDKEYLNAVLKKAEDLLSSAKEKEAAILVVVHNKIEG
jgi:hypothetical protein